MHSEEGRFDPEEEERVFEDEGVRQRARSRSGRWGTRLAFGLPFVAVVLIARGWERVRRLRRFLVRIR
jgi:hypothetical protein